MLLLLTVVIVSILKTPEEGWTASIEFNCTVIHTEPQLSDTPRSFYCWKRVTLLTYLYKQSYYSFEGNADR